MTLGKIITDLSLGKEEVVLNGFLALLPLQLLPPKISSYGFPLAPGATQSLGWWVVGQASTVACVRLNAKTVPFVSCTQRA